MMASSFPTTALNTDPSQDIAVISREIGLEAFLASLSLTAMQPGRNPAFAQALIAAFESEGIPCILTGEMPHALPDFALDLS